MRANAAPDTQALRSWQRRALVRYLAAQPRDFLAVATPGSGKTAFALRVAGELLADGAVEQITVVVPTEHLKTQWALAAARVGIALDPKFSNSAAHTSSEYHGVVVTYAQVASHPTRHRVRTENRRTLVVFDEIHHGGDAKSWGEAIREAFDDATRRLALTGTPFRSDDSAIPFVTYAPDGDGLMRSQADHTYGYAEALADGVVRPVVFLAYSGEARWRTSAGEEHAARLGEPLNAEQTARAWRTVLDAKGEWIPAVLQAADTRLTQLRNGGVPDAGRHGHRVRPEGRPRLCRRADQADRRDTDGRAVRRPGSSARIADFSAGTSRWLVAVRMVSEGVDVPRLAVGVYATSASTPLFFAQAIGRYVRSRQPGRRRASSCRRCRPCSTWPARWRPSATTCSASRTASRRATTSRSRTRRAETRADDDNGFESLGADAELDQVIFDGSSFGTATPAGSDEEADYLGIPGLLDAEAMRDLLRRRQEAQMTRRSRAVGDIGPSTASHLRVAKARPAAGTAQSAQHAGVRRTSPDGQAARLDPQELRRICGGPPIAAATTEQLQARIEAVRQLRV